LGPPGGSQRGGGIIRRSPAAGSDGDVRGVVLGWLGAGFGRSSGQWWRRRWGSAATAGASQGGSLSGEGRARPE
jgi:hypothetical protein